MNQLLKMENHFENDYCKMAIKDEILYCTFAPFLDITFDVATVLVADRIKFSNNKIYPVLTDISNLKYIHYEAREFLSSEEGTRNVSIAAYVATSQHEKFIWDMFLQINKPGVYSKIFFDKKEAIKWLRMYNS